MLNRVILMGRLTANPEMHYTKTNGIPVIGFSLAVDRRYSKDKEKETDFINIVAWKSTAEFVCKHFTKGQTMCVEGRLQQRKWKDDDDNIRIAYEVIAESVHFAGGYKNDEGQINEDFDPFEGEVA